MRTDPNGLAFIQNDDLIGVADRTDSLGNDHAGNAAELFGKTFSQRCIGFVVQCGEGVIENQNLGISRQRTGDCQTLLLSAGNIGSAL